ncbi:MAG TPA: hypothetical protein VE244_01325, partial [Nitrososphaeraceae archaeon]|nr:hypothetical protein [Nitrososphaeraceae archaeon]
MRNPFRHSGSPYERRRTTPEGEPLENIERGRGFSNPFVRIVIPAIIGIIILLFVVSASVKIVDAGHRGVLLRFGAVDTGIAL